MTYQFNCTLPDEILEPIAEEGLEVLRVAAEGETNKGIGLRLGITDRSTVKAHFSSIYNKLGVDSRAAAIAAAARRGWLA
jgi:two-component system, NarL family, response regulator YdfI